MKLIIEINLDNAAFENAEHGTAYVLREIAHEFQHGERFVHLSKTVRDENGNTVGMTRLDK